MGGVERPSAERQRDRVLSEDEIRILWAVLDHEPQRIAIIFRLGLLTAQRRGEILGMRWAELDLNGGWWTISGERAK
jgi:integrase